MCLQRGSELGDLPAAKGQRSHNPFKAPAGLLDNGRGASLANFNFLTTGVISLTCSRERERKKEMKK